MLASDACAHALQVLDGPLGENLFETEAAVEEFALQSLSRKQGLRFAQLSDFGPRPEEKDGFSAKDPNLLPLTKVERVPESEDPTAGARAGNLLLH